MKKRVRIIILVGFICALSLCVFFLFMNQSKSYYYLNDFPINIEQGSVSRSGTISPLPQGTYEDELSMNEVKRIFHIDEDLSFDATSYKFKLIKTASEDIHTIDLFWQFEDGIVRILIAPNNYPSYLFSEENNVTIIDKYIISVRRSGSDVQSESAIIDVGIKSYNDMGVLISGSEHYADLIEKWFNIILSQGIDLDSFEQLISVQSLGAEHDKK